MTCYGSDVRFLVLLVAACSSSASPPALGTLTIDGAPTPIERCRVVENARNDGIALDLFYARGRVRFTRHALYLAKADTRDDNFDDGGELHCTKLDRKWGGGLRTDGRPGGYWGGFIDARCDRVVGRIELTCGDPTPAEMAELDANLAKAKGSGSALPSP